MIMQAFFRSILALMCVVGVPSLAMAQPRTDALQHAFSMWLDTHRTTGVIATGTLQEDGKWSVTAHGDDPTVRVELASLTKAVTAVCVWHLIEADMVAWSDNVQDILSDGPDVTIAELITHTTGLGPDSTQIAMPPWLGQTADENGHFSAQVLDFVNARPAQQGVRGTYQYNNENYALLGLVVEAVTQQPYFDACKSRLDLPDGIQPSLRTSAFQPWGGLTSDVRAFLTFVHTHFGPGSKLADDPFAFPHADMGGGAFYGLGMVFREFGDGYNFWHFGASCFPGRLNTGSFVVIWEGRVSAVAFYDACLEWDAMFALDNALSAAAYGRAP